MNRAWFEYKGISSIDMHLYIENGVSFPSPEADVEFLEVLGRDGEVALNNERLKGVPFQLPVRLKLPEDLTVEQAATKISNWLKNGIGWSRLRFSGSPEYEYVAMCVDGFDVIQTLTTYGKTVISFRLKPYKMLADSPAIEISNGGVLFNPSARNSKPVLHIQGSGNVTIKNNGIDWIKLNGVDRRITIDSDLMAAYKDDLPQYDKVAELDPMFPLLNPGENKITWSGSVTKIEILPRWEVIV